MKKGLSILAALAMCVTIGGVYATWEYAQGEVAPANGYFDKITTITDKVITTAKGSISVDTSTLKIEIDQEDVVGSYNTVLSEFSGYITITFKPNSGVDAVVETQGIEMSYQLFYNDVNGEWGYKGQRIFTLDTQVVTSGERKLTWTITADELDDLIQLNTIELDEVAKYDAYKAALHAGSIGILVSEVK